MKKVTIISGAAGMTGCATAEKLLARGEWVVGFDNFFAGSRADVDRLAGQARFKFFEYDLTRAADMDAMFAFVRREFPAADSRLAFLNCAAACASWKPNRTASRRERSIRRARRP